MKTRKYAIYALIATVFFLIGSLFVNKVVSDKNEKVLEAIKQEQRNREFRDSVMLSIYKQKILDLDSTRIIMEAKSIYYEKNIDKLKKEYAELKIEYESINYKDDLDECISRVEKQEEAIQTADSIIDSQDKLIANKDEQLNIERNKYDTELAEKLRIRKMYNNANSNIETLKDRLEKENTWWKRNGKYFYFGVGFTAGVLIAK